jgi:hypothetical protein
MKLKWTIRFIILLMGLSAGRVSAQEIALKTNALYWATATPNLGVEVALAPKWTLDLSGGYNPWVFSDNTKWKHWLAQPEVRYWLCEKMGGHFFGFHLHGGQYNIGNIDTDFRLFGTDFSLLKDYRFQGWFIRAGLGYGYAWMLGKHWNLETEIGLGYSYTRYDRYLCPECGKKLEEGKEHHYLGPTKAALNLVYVF